MSEIFSHNTSDKPREACGVFGLYSRELAGELAQRTYFGLYALQHRGQESAGVALSDGERTTDRRDMGLRSGERRVGKEWRYRWAPYHLKKHQHRHLTE